MTRAIPLLCLMFLCSCYTSKSIRSYAAKNGFTIQEVRSIDLFEGKILFNTSHVGNMESTIFLLYKGDSLRYISNNKKVVNGNFLYTLRKESDSVNMLIRSTQLRYFTADTLLFYKDFVVQKRNLTLDNQQVQSFFTVFHFTKDSLVKYYRQSIDQYMPAGSYASDEKAASEFRNAHSEIHKYAHKTKSDFFRDFGY